MSLKYQVDTFAIPPKWLFEPTVMNYKEMVFGGVGKSLPSGMFMKATLNSLIVTALTLLGSSLLGIPAGYAIARFDFRGKRLISFWILSLLMVPPVISVIPLHRIILRLGLYDSRLGLAVVCMSFITPFFMWMVRSFFQAIPRELEEAAIVDGCSQFGAFMRIALPLALPGIAIILILSFIFSWNEFLFAFLLTGKSAVTAPVAIANFISFEVIVWGRIAAGGILIMFPPILFAFFAHRYIIMGLTFGAIKG